MYSPVEDLGSTYIIDFCTVLQYTNKNRDSTILYLRRVIGLCVCFVGMLALQLITI